MDKIVMPLINKGQSSYQIITNHLGLNISVCNLYSYIDEKYLMVCNIDLKHISPDEVNLSPIEFTFSSYQLKNILSYVVDQKMSIFYINIDGITKSTNELLDVSNGINTVALKVSDIAQDLKNIGLGQFSGYAVRISAKSSGLQILQDVSEKINFLKIFRINMDLMMIKEILGEIICKQD